MKTLLKSIVISTTLLLPSLVQAAADCPDIPKIKWMSKLQMQRIIVNDYGIMIKTFKIDGNCYEVYGWIYDENGDEKKAEVYFNPVTGKVVKSKIK